MPSPLLLRLRLAALVVGVFLVGANSFILGPILADVAATLKTEPVAVARAISAFGAAAAFSAFFLSGLIDRYAMRPVLAGSAFLLMGGFAGSALSHSWQTLSVFQALAGIATGVLLPAIYSEAVRSAPEGQGTRVFGLVLSGWSIALIVGVPLSALLSDVLDWRLAYGVLALLAGLACMVFAATADRQPPAQSGESHSRRAVIRVRGVISMLATGFLFMTVFYGTYALLGLRMRDMLGISASAASLAVMAYGVGFGLGGALARHVDRIGPAKVFPLFLAGSGLVYLSLALATRSFWLSLLATFLLGIFNHFGLNLTVLLLALRKPEARGTLIGLNTTATYIAVFVGPLLMGALYAGIGFGAVSLSAFALLAVCVALMWRLSKADAAQ
ncbi:MFS transporter [uncultured Martelella sp.]|uniref:MFS transporter n=1 Tax=uncultured Martelella sp. TaxID=392331 RepID=UPI0029C7DA0D|nr:MFS transporter [uncultured Martelella sp.]